MEKFENINPLPALRKKANAGGKPKKSMDQSMDDGDKDGVDDGADDNDDNDDEGWSMVTPFFQKNIVYRN